MSHGIATDDLTQLPSRRDEGWRWSDLRGLIRQPLPGSEAFGEAVRPGGPFESLGLAEVVLANGHLNWWPEGEVSDGVDVTVHDTPTAPHMSATMPMARLAASEASDPKALIVTFKGAGAPGALVRLVSHATDSAHHTRVGVMVEPGVSALLCESYEGRGSGYLANTLVEIFVGRDARLERLVIADDDATGVSVSSTEVHLAPGAAFSQTVVTTGAKRQRIETRVNHPGGGASLRLDGLYLIDGRRHGDITTVVVHQGPDGTTEQLTKGVAADQGRGVFQGRIEVAPGADRTDAKMGHHALVLSDHAEVDAKPELEIYADDVVCSHGNTIGALDEEALFYARQRGIPEAEARAMLTEAFVGEVVDRIEHEGARDIVRTFVSARTAGLA